MKPGRKYYLRQKKTGNVFLPSRPFLPLSEDESGLYTWSSISAHLHLHWSSTTWMLKEWLRMEMSNSLPF